MVRKIRRAAVLGSGVMGASIAAHLANVGIETYLLDIVPQVLAPEEKLKGMTEADPRFRNKLANAAKANLAKQKPSPIFTKASLDRIKTGNFQDDLHIVGKVDWVIEVVVENLKIKQELLAKVEEHWVPGTILSSNTSGISINRIVEERSIELQRHFLGTHFFNPPRYMKLLEIIPTEETLSEIVNFMSGFCEKTLGKGVVIAKDTPNFIANRIGTYGLMVTLQEMMKQGISTADVDALTGPLIGRPKSATFRTLDLVGLDTFVHVAKNVYDNVTDLEERKVFETPDVLHYMVAQRYIGDKAGQGFYLKKKTSVGKEIQQFDYRTREYVSLAKAAFPSLERAKNANGLKEKLRLLAFADDAGGQFVWTVLKKVMLYSAAKIPEIADDITAIDEAMKWGFNWELGPFETWDLLGVEKTVARMEAEGEQIPLWVSNMLQEGKKSFYEEAEGKTFFIQLSGEAKEIAKPLEKISLKDLKEQNRVIKKNAGASLIDLGDDVACLEFHSPNNAIGQDIIQIIQTSLEEVRQNYRGLVIGNQGKNFCVGANLMLLLMEAQDENWFEIEQIVRNFHEASMAMKYFEKPIVSAPHNMTLGGGVEMCLPAARVQAAAETYMGLVEVGVGLIPGGAGTKEMLVRATLAADFDGKVNLQPVINRVFETIATAKVSTSGPEAQDIGYLRGTDGISINRDHQLYHAKQAVLAMAMQGYEPPQRKRIRVAGEPGLAVLKSGIYQMKMSGYISEHDELIVKKLAHVLAGGSIRRDSLVSEEYLLDLEREAFLSLCGEPKSQARMQHMLTKGKPLRN
jgi:3-hydroxyacyl-CoA dehydrogenase